MNYLKPVGMWDGANSMDYASIFRRQEKQTWDVF